jgi:Saxitoxin biosynthesis operon protein SxtJ
MDTTPSKYMDATKSRIGDDGWHQTHQSIHSQSEVKIGSNRNFGIVFGLAFLLIATGPLLRGGTLRWWALAIAVAFGAAAFVAPAVLRPLNVVWFKLGIALHHVVNPIIMGAIFFGAVTPMGMLLRALGKDHLRLKRSQQSSTYWIERERPAPAPGSMSKQF